MLPTFTFLFIWCYSPDVPCVRHEFETTSIADCEYRREDLNSRFGDTGSVYIGKCIEIDYD